MCQFYSASYLDYFGNKSDHRHQEILSEVRSSKFYCICISLGVFKSYGKLYEKYFYTVHPFAVGCGQKRVLYMMLRQPVRFCVIHNLHMGALNWCASQRLSTSLHACTVHTEQAALPPYSTPYHMSTLRRELALLSHYAVQPFTITMHQTYNLCQFPCSQTKCGQTKCYGKICLISQLKLFSSRHKSCWSTRSEWHLKSLVHINSLFIWRLFNIYVYGN